MPDPIQEYWIPVVRTGREIVGISQSTASAVPVTPEPRAVVSGAETNELPIQAIRSTEYSSEVDSPISLHIRTIQLHNGSVPIPDVILHNLNPSTDLLTLQHQIQRDHQQMPRPREQQQSVNGRPLTTSDTDARQLTLAEAFGEERLASSRLEIQLTVDTRGGRQLNTKEGDLAGRHLRTPDSTTDTEMEARMRQSLNERVARGENASEINNDDWFGPVPEDPELAGWIAGVIEKLP